MYKFHGSADSGGGGHKGYVEVEHLNTFINMDEECRVLFKPYSGASFITKKYLVCWKDVEKVDG